MKVIKNKVAQPFGEGYTVLTFAKGINHSGELVESGLDAGVFWQKNSQSAIYYKPLDSAKVDLSDTDLEKEADDNGEVMYKIGRGKNNVIEVLDKYKSLYDAASADLGKILDEIREGKDTNANMMRATNEEEGADEPDVFE